MILIGSTIHTFFIENSDNMTLGDTRNEMQDYKETLNPRPKPKLNL